MAKSSRREPAHRATLVGGASAATACIRTFKRFDDPEFAEKVEDIVGL
jgi:hypothetical protein